jgi:hypothetical protein
MRVVPALSKPEDQTTSQRFEAKYIISEMQTQEILDYIEPYLTTDKHATWGVPYVVNSLYLDNDRLRLYWSSKGGEKNRIKLRIRAYTERPEDPVFFEIKRRMNQVILKQRAIVARDAVERVLLGQDVPPECFLASDIQEMENLCQFRDYAESLDAGPMCMVRYTREAYMSNLEEPVRITFDRDLSALYAPFYTPDVWIYDSRWLNLDAAQVILELKFTNLCPAWAQRMIDRFNLLQFPFAKYLSCLEGLKKEGLLFPWKEDPHEDPLWSVLV